MKSSALIPIFLLIILLSFSCSASAAISFYIADQLVESSTPFMAVNGLILVPVSVLGEYLAADIDMSNDGHKAVIHFPTLSVALTVGETEVLVSGEKQILDLEPQIKNGEMMVPLRFIADLLGFRIVFDNNNGCLYLIVTEEMAELIAAKRESNVTLDLSFLDSLDLEAAIDPLANPVLKEIIYLGGSRSKVFIDMEGTVSYESFLLTTPDRLVIDLKNTISDAVPQQEINGEIVKTVRSSYFDEKTVRVVFDLNKLTDYKISRWPGGGLEIEFNYQISDVGFYRNQANESRLWFSANQQPSFQYQELPNPLRLVIDFQDSSLLDGAKEIMLEDSRVRSLRVSQFNNSVTRVVLDLKQPLAPAIVEAVNNRYEIVFYEGTVAEYNAVIQKQLEIEREYMPDPDDIISSGSDILSEAESADLPLNGRVICVDPGHGGNDPGAITDAIWEKEINLAIGLKLGKIFEDAGALVVYTRNDDSYVSQFDRPKIANLAGTDIFISIHANSYQGAQAASGIETLYNPLFLENFRFAQTLQKQMISSLGTNDRGVRPRTDLAVLNGATMPAVLIETGFINNDTELALLLDPGYQDQLSQAIYEGVLLFFANYR